MSRASAGLRRRHAASAPCREPTSSAAAAQGASARSPAGRHALRGLRAHAAGRRAGPPATAGRAVVCELCRPLRRDGADALAARPLTRARRAPCAARAPGAPGAGAADRLRAAVDPVTARRHDRPPARGGLRVPRRHRQPRGVHRPLPGDWRLTREDSYGRGAGARFRVEAPLTASLGRHDASSRSSRRAGSSRRPRRQVQPHPLAAASGRSTRPPAAATRVSSRPRPSPTLPTDRFMEALGGPAAGSSASAQGAAPPARRSSRRTATAARAPRSPAGGRAPGLRSEAYDSPRRMHRALRPLAARASPSSPPSRGRLRQQGGRRPLHGRDRGHLPRRRRAEVPGADLAPAQPGRPRGPRLPRRACRDGHEPLERRRGLVRRLHARRERRRERRARRPRDFEIKRHRRRTLPAGRRSARSNVFAYAAGARPGPRS